MKYQKHSNTNRRKAVRRLFVWQSVIIVSVAIDLVSFLSAWALDPDPDYKVFVFPTLLMKSGHSATPVTNTESDLIRDAWEVRYENFWKETSYNRHNIMNGETVHGDYIDTKVFGYVHLPWPMSTPSDTNLTGHLSRSITSYTRFSSPYFPPWPFKDRGIGEENWEVPPVPGIPPQLFGGSGALVDQAWTSGEAFEDVDASANYTEGILDEDRWIASNHWWDSSAYRWPGILRIPPNIHSLIEPNNPVWRGSPELYWDDRRGELYADYNGNTVTNKDQVTQVGFDSSVTIYIADTVGRTNKIKTISEFDFSPDNNVDSHEGDFFHRYLAGDPGGQANIPTNGMFDYNIVPVYLGPLVYRCYNNWITNNLIYCTYMRYENVDGTEYTSTNQCPTEPVQKLVPVYQASELFGELWRTTGSENQYMDTVGPHGTRTTDRGTDGRWDVGADAEPFEDFISWWNPYGGITYPPRGWFIWVDPGSTNPAATVRPDRPVWAQISMAQYAAYISWNYLGNTNALIARAGNGQYDGPDNWYEADNNKYKQTGDLDPIILSAPHPGVSGIAGAPPKWDTQARSDFTGGDWATWWLQAFGSAAPGWGPPPPLWYEIPDVFEYDPGNSKSPSNYTYVVSTQYVAGVGLVISSNNAVGGWVPDIGHGWSYDSAREFHDLPSSLYHCNAADMPGTVIYCPDETWVYLPPSPLTPRHRGIHYGGDGRLGEITSPTTHDIYGEDVGVGDPARPDPPDFTYESAGPLAVNIHGDNGFDAGNLLTFEWLTRRYEPGLGADTGRYTRDTNLDGIIDQGESRQGYPNYNLDNDDFTFNSGDDYENWTVSWYPFNRHRYVEDCIEAWDQAQDFSMFTNGPSVYPDRRSPLYAAPLVAPGVGNSGGRAGGKFDAWTRDTTDYMIGSGSRDFEFVANISDSQPSAGSPTSVGITGGGEGDIVAYNDFARSWIAHEQCHDWWGLPDLYDYDVWNGPPLINEPAGAYDLMAKGGMVHGFPDMKWWRTVVNRSIYGDNSHDWIVPQYLRGVGASAAGSILRAGGGPVTLELYPIEEDQDNYFVYERDRNGDGQPDEMFWFSYTANDTVFGVRGGPGVYVSHTDYADNNFPPPGWPFDVDTWDETPLQQRLNNHFTWELVQADGSNHLQDAVNLGDTGDPFPGSTGKGVFSPYTDPSSRWWDQTDSGIRITKFQLPAVGSGEPALVTFEMYDPSAEWEWPAYGTDSDNDGMVDVWEYHFFGNLTTANASTDSDYDGLTDVLEYLCHSDPTDRFSQDPTRTVMDGWYDSDGDGLANKDEGVYGTDPLNPDTDDDTFTDGDEVNFWVMCGDRWVTDPTYSHSPLIQRSMQTTGTAVQVPSWQIDFAHRFELTNWTIECWVNLTATGQTGRLIERTTYYGQTNFVLGITTNVPYTGFTSEGGARYFISASSAIGTGEWVHVAGVWNTSNDVLRLYTNGIFVTEKPCIEDCAIGVGAVTNGGTRTGTVLIGNGVNSYMDEVRIWGEARTEAQISAGKDLFGGGSTGVSANLVAWYPFDDGGTSAEDYVYLLDWNYALTNVTFSTNVYVDLGMYYDGDGDGLPDWWEISHGLDPNVATGSDGGYGDPDQDGLNNLGEYLAGTYPNVRDTDGDGFGDYDSRSGPNARTWGELYDDGDGIPDEWEIQYRDPAPSTGLRGLDPAYYDADLDPDEDGWSNYAEYMGSYMGTNALGSNVLIRSSNPLSPTNYPQPLVSIHARYSGILGSSIEDISGNPTVHLDFYSSPARDGFPVATLDMIGAISTNRVFTTGHVVEGTNYVFGYVDVDGSGTWEANSEPAGIAQFDMGWSDVNNVEIGLTDELSGYPRFNWPVVNGAKEYILKFMQGATELFTRTVNNAARNYLHEGDYLLAGRYGLGNGTYNCQIYTNASVYGMEYLNYYRMEILIVAKPALTTPAFVTPHDFTYSYARNETEWTMDINATAYTLQIATNSGGSIISSVTAKPPYRDQAGNYCAAFPFYAGDTYASGMNWINGRYWMRIQASTPSSSSISAWRAFNLDLQTPANGGKSMISGDIYYFGKVSRGYTNDATGSTNLTIIMQSFLSEGFSGEADGQVQISYNCNSNAPSADKGDYTLLGLHNGEHYVRAFIDVNGNRRLDAFEPYGFAKDLISGTDYEPKGIDLSGPGSVRATDVRIVIRDRDTDDDQLPDGWEWQYWGNLNYGAYDDPDNDGVNNLTEYVDTLADSDPANPDTDGDGLLDGYEIAHGLSAHNSDTDGDGLSDGYEVTHGLNSLNPAGDADGDGLSDAEEVLFTRTDPRDANDALRIALTSYAEEQQATLSGAETQQDLFFIQWEGRSGVAYQVQYSIDLKVWQDAPNGAFSGDGIHTYADEESVTCAVRFYRIVVR